MLFIIMTLKLYIIVNGDLNMSIGKTGSQIGHIVQLMIENIIFNENNDNEMNVERYKRYMEWRNNMTKIVLNGDTKLMTELLDDENVIGFRDKGNTTEVPNNSLTVICYYPCLKAELDKRVQDLRLLN